MSAVQILTIILGILLVIGLHQLHKYVIRKTVLPNLEPEDETDE